MYIARILFPIDNVLGPGKRIGIWVSGCGKRCLGCSNPELWHQKPEQRITIEQLSHLLHRLSAEHVVDGITITGGEPLDQWEELCLLLDAISDITRDVLLYTGYTFAALPEELRKTVSTRVAVIIDGAYIQELNTGSALIGSSNQQLHYCKVDVMPLYRVFLRAPARTQNFTISGSSLVSVGIHRPGYNDDLPCVAKKKGLIPRND